MTPRVKLLAIGLLVALVIWQGGGVVSETLIGPLTDLQNQVVTLDGAIAKKEMTKARILKATRDLKAWTDRSLPSNRTAAATLYQAWLIELAEKHKLSRVSVSTAARGDTRAKFETYYSVPATLKAEGTLSQLCDFLHAFHSSGLLHRVNAIEASTTRHQGDPTLAVTVSVEGVALLRAEPRTTQLASASLKPRAGRSRAEFDSVVSGNLFVRGYNGPPPPPKKVEAPPVVVVPPKPVEPPFDAREFTKLVGSVKLDGKRESWLYDQSSDTLTVLTEGSRFKAAGVEGICLVIGTDFVQLQVERDTYLMQMGQSLKEIRKMPSPMVAAPEVRPPAEANPDVPKEPAASKPAEETPAPEKPTGEKPTDEKLAPDKPAGESPAEKPAEAKTPEKAAGEPQPEKPAPAQPSDS